MALLSLLVAVVGVVSDDIAADTDTDGNGVLILRTRLEIRPKFGLPSPVAASHPGTAPYPYSAQDTVSKEYLINGKMAKWQNGKIGKWPKIGSVCSISHGKNGKNRQEWQEWQE